MKGRIKRRASIDAGVYCDVCEAWSNGTSVRMSGERRTVWLCLVCVRHITKAAAQATLTKREEHR